MTDGFADSLQALSSKTRELRGMLEDHLAHWPSPRLAWRSGALSELITAIDTEAEKAIVAQERKERTQAWRAQNEDRREYDEHTKRMAANFVRPDGGTGITPAEFLDWQEQQRKRMQDAPSLEEQMAKAPLVGPR